LGAVVRLPVVVRRVAPGVVGVVPTGRVASRVALGTVVVPGAYTVPGIAPAGATPVGVVRVPLVLPFRVPVVAPLGTVPIVVLGCPGAPAPGVMGAVGATGTVWANAVVLRPRPSRAAMANPVVFICYESD